MTRDDVGFREIYPSMNDGARIVTNKICRIDNISKRNDGNYEVFASYEYSRLKTHPISIVLNRNGQIVSSKGISYGYFDKTLEYAKKIGCLTGEEGDAVLEQIIKSKDLKKKLNDEAELEIYNIYGKLDMRGSLVNNYGYTSGNVVVTNRSPYALEYGDFTCKVNFYNSRGDVIETEDLSIFTLKAYGSESSYVFSSSNAAVKYKFDKDIVFTEGLKSRVKEQIIRRSTYGCF